MSRVQQQARTREAVLAAARAEFAERGFGEAKIDRIAERADLTRGAVYSNFPSKRALYLAVLLADADTPGAASDLPGASLDTPGAARHLSGAASDSPGPASDSPGPALDLPGAAEAFARDWLERLPLATGDAAAGRLRARSLTGVLDDERGRATLAQLTRLEALLLAVALESVGARVGGRRVRPAESDGRRVQSAESDGRRVRSAEPDGRRVRLAELILTLLHGASGLAETAPGFGDPFDLARACRHLTGLDLGDTWDPPHLAYVAAARPVREAWHPAAEVVDELSGRPVGLDGDGVVVLLGAGRLEAAEEAVRAARPGDTVTVVLASDDPAETGALVRLRVTTLTASLRRVFGTAIRPSLRVVLDDRPSSRVALDHRGAVDAGAAFDTETAVRVKGGEVVARADGRGAGHAVAVAVAGETR